MRFLDSGGENCCTVALLVSIWSFCVCFFVPKGRRIDFFLLASEEGTTSLVQLCVLRRSRWCRSCGNFSLQVSNCGSCSNSCSRFRCGGAGCADHVVSRAVNFVAKFRFWTRGDSCSKVRRSGAGRAGRAVSRVVNFVAGFSCSNLCSKFRCGGAGGAGRVAIFGANFQGCSCTYSCGKFDANFRDTRQEDVAGSPTQSRISPSTQRLLRQISWRRRRWCSTRQTTTSSFAACRL